MSDHQDETPTPNEGPEPTPDVGTTASGNGHRPPTPPLHEPGTRTTYSVDRASEAALLGAFLNGADPHLVDTTVWTIPRAQAVHHACLELHDGTGRPLDLRLVVARTGPELEDLHVHIPNDCDAKGQHALAALVHRAATKAQAATFAGIVKHHARHRAITAAIPNIEAALRTGDPQHALDQLEAIARDTANTDVDPSLQPVDLEPVLDGTTIQPMPTLLARDDGKSLFYDTAVNSVHGDSGSGKGWVMCMLVAANAARGVRTMLLDFEDTAVSITARLLALGMTADQILTWVIYIRPQVPLDTTAVAHLCNTIRTSNVGAVIIDSIGEAFGLEGIDENKDVEVGPWIRRVARPLADTGAGVVIVDHSTKAADNPLHPSGSKRKRAAVTGASYLAEAIQPFVKGQGGRLRLTCAKDRHGNYRRGEAVGDLVMNSNPSGIDLRLYAPTVMNVDATVPTILASRAAVEAAKRIGRPVSRNELEGLMKIKARAEVKRGGIDHAIAEGALTARKAGRAIEVEYQHDLKDDE